MELSFLAVAKFVHLSRYTRYCLVVPVLHDSMMISQVRVGMFCYFSLFRTRDKPSVEAWAIMEVSQLNNSLLALEKRLQRLYK